MQKKLIKVHPSDNVLVALINLENGEQVNFEDAQISFINSDMGKAMISSDLSDFNKIIFLELMFMLHK